ncbi:lipopolysaccharide core biosynthesis protein rfaS [Flavobacterium sp.]|uniref:lipopolysaccharide core biosynthesis protein rfaS n=1 Tax=Flavobacterium sp. TaxID=239 RepID=UPI00286F4B00|nr:lipopolysaccharide core biosynthesis protein rfaS [Flavobacterium sp.]
MLITIISYDEWKLNSDIIVNLQKKGHTVNHIDFNQFKYKYPNFLFKIYNFFLKYAFNINLKHIHFGKKIIEKLDSMDKIQDVILITRGDYIDAKYILKIKQYSKKSIAYFNDNIRRYPKIIKIIPLFDQVYSFEKSDCEKYQLKFITNWICDFPEITDTPQIAKYNVFNISTKDNRQNTIKRIANELKNNTIKSKIIIYNKTKNKKEANIDYITNKIPLSTVKEYIKQSDVLLDVNKNGQTGLTFRVFESLGWHKKLITTNEDIKNYDFYNPNNILVIDPKKPIIPISFFETEYEEIPSHIYNRYTLNNWVNTIFELENH